MENKTAIDTELLIADQLGNWELAKNNYNGLKKIILREIVFDNDFRIKIQFNPERIRSSAAKVDAISIQERPCFLCMKNLPPEQRWVDFKGKFNILVNPFPIFTKHLTIASKEHTNQRIEGYFDSLLQISESLSDYVVFYNGPQCGASAPDHFHFQAGIKGFLPIEDEFALVRKNFVKQEADCNMFAIDNYLRKVLVFTGSDKTILNSWFNNILGILKNLIPSDPEPMLNIVAYRFKNKWHIFIFPRKKHRPGQFYKEGVGQILLSPASVDFGGLLITPREEDFHKISKFDITDIFNQVSICDNVWEEIKKIVNHKN